MVGGPIAAAFLLAWLAGSLLNAQESPEPFHRAGAAEYVGPGREEPPPEGLAEVRLGYFGPSDPDDPEAGLAWLAAAWAIEEANAKGGYEGLPFRLIPAWSEDPWGSGVGQVARMVYEDEVWAIVGGIDGPSTHLAEQVVTKARLPLLSPGGTDESVNLTNVPWMLSCLPADRYQAEAIAPTLVRAAAGGSLVFLSANDHDSHTIMVQIRAALRRRGTTPRLDLELRAGEPDLTRGVAEALSVDPAAVLVVAQAHDAARLLRVLRRSYAGPVFGDGRMGRRRFLLEAGRAAEGVVLPRLHESSDDWDDFVASFTRRFGHEPDYLAAQTYDVVGMLVAAVREAGLNRVRILDALREISPRSGAAGRLEWDPQGRNLRGVTLARVRDGRIVSR